MGKLNIEAKDAKESDDQEQLLLKYVELGTLKEFMTSYEKSMLASESQPEENKSDSS